MANTLFGIFWRGAILKSSGRILFDKREVAHPKLPVLKIEDKLLLAQMLEQKIAKTEQDLIYRRNYAEVSP